MQSDNAIVFYDVEVFPNLFLVCWKKAGEDKITRMINPTPQEIESLLSYRLIGFNCRGYDNHILFARLRGYDNEHLYSRSKKIINGSSDAHFKEAFDLSYADVYDFSGKKQSLKKFEIELGIHHQELELSWDEPVPEELWEKVAEYCDNDVIATEAVFNSRQADFRIRQILADITDMRVNDSARSLTAKMIFGSDHNPQKSFNYRDLGCEEDTFISSGDEFINYDEKGRPVFPGYKYDSDKSYYRGEEFGRRGYIYTEPGMYTSVASLKIASMNQDSIIAENLFGDAYTQRFRDILDARAAIEQKDYDKAKNLLGKKSEKYFADESSAQELSETLKTVINSVCRLSAAGYDNYFRDAHNRDNIVAKRGALFMINLKHMLQNKGFTAAYIRRDTVKIPDATAEIIDAVTEYGRKYGYNFVHNETYKKLCVVNGDNFAAKCSNGEWTVSGELFRNSYVFKTLFSREPVEFDDLCETKYSVTSLCLDMTEDLQDAPDKEHDYVFIGKVGKFCPVKKGCGGGILLVKDDEGEYSPASGTEGFMWQESEIVRNSGREDDIDMSFYEKSVNKTIDIISEYGDFNWFIS